MEVLIIVERCFTLVLSIFMYPCNERVVKMSYIWKKTGGEE